MPKLTSVHYKRLVCVFENEGFVYSRTEGSHMSFTKPGFRTLVIPKYQEVPVFIIKNLIRTSGISMKRYFELLAQY